jgi:hypothetical protein
LHTESVNGPAGHSHDEDVVPTHADVRTLTQCDRQTRVNIQLVQHDDVLRSHHKTRQTVQVTNRLYHYSSHWPSHAWLIADAVDVSGWLACSTLKALHASSNVAWRCNPFQPHMPTRREQFEHHIVKLGLSGPLFLASLPQVHALHPATLSVPT